LAKPPPQKPDSTPEEFAEVEPHELFPTNNIRFVMWETARLTERVEGLTKAIESLGTGLDRSFDKHGAEMKERLGEIKSDLRDNAGKIDKLEDQVSRVKGAMYAIGVIFTVLAAIAAIIVKLK